MFVVTKSFVFCRETRHWQPYRFREEEPDDPDRAVSFDDLKPFLVVFEEPSSRFRLAVTFIRFLGFDCQVRIYFN